MKSDSSILESIFPSYIQLTFGCEHKPVMYSTFSLKILSVQELI